MTRTERLLILVREEIERNRASLDADGATRTLRLVIHQNEGGWPCTVFLERTTGQPQRKATLQTMR